SLGLAFLVCHQVLRQPRSFVMDHAYWGPEYSHQEICRAVDSSGLAQKGCVVRELQEEELMRRAAAIIAEGKILGWFQGRAEWGTRALGNLSIVADPPRPEMKECLNRPIKHRETYQPFTHSHHAYYHLD